jgi:FkbM family methyltransferase
MIRTVKGIIKKILPPKYHYSLIKIKHWFTDGYSVRSYSQEGEDMILRRIFEKQDRGFYVDVGAHHPRRFSNTYYFYKSGWRGINIDAMPGSMKTFNKDRPKDINLEIPVSSKKEKLTYYAFSDPALNGFSEDLSRKRDAEGENKIIFTKELQAVPLKEILSRYLPQDTQIGFLSVDVEGMELDVLQSSDWSRYRPKVVLVEQRMISLGQSEASEIAQFMRSNGYLPYAKTTNSVFYLLS